MAENKDETTAENKHQEIHHGFPWSFSSQLYETGLATLAGLVPFVLFFKYPIASRLNAIPGNIGDAKYIIYLCEHWYQVFTGQAAWLSPGMFYPVTGALGYSDALFLIGLMYAPLRAIGLDPYASYQIIVLALPVIGFIGAWWLFRYWMRFSYLAAFSGATLFAFSSALYNSMAHAQLQAVSFLPYLVILFCVFASRLSESSLKATSSGVAVALIFPLLAYTSFYTAWYLLFWCVLAALLVIMYLLAVGKLSTVPEWMALQARSWPIIALTIFVGAVASIPFLVTYLPVLQLFPRRAFEEVVPMLPVPIDLINAGFENIAWGWLLKDLEPGLQLRPTFWELDKGLPLLTFGFFIIGTLLSVLCAWRRADRTSLATATAAVSVWIIWILMLRFDGNSLWWYIYQYFPGAGAIRSVYRFNICLMLPIALVIAYALDQGLRFARQKGSRMTISVLCFLAIALILEQTNLHVDVLRKSIERAFIASVPPAPDTCRVMTIVAEQDNHSGWWAPLNIDAMLIAQANHIPTVNGYSGWTPPDWRLHYAWEPGYPERVRDWIDSNNVTSNLCAFHFESRRWTVF